MNWYRPGAVVLQCGTDSLAGDRLGTANLTERGHGACAKFMRTFNVPMILLGGGGYSKLTIFFFFFFFFFFLYNIIKNK